MEYLLVVHALMVTIYKHKQEFVRLLTVPLLTVYKEALLLIVLYAINVLMDMLYHHLVLAL